MGAFDQSYDDDKVAAHEERKLKRDLGVKDLQDYTTEELKAELARREEIDRTTYKDITIDKLKAQPALFEHVSQYLLIQYPNGNNEYSYLAWSEAVWNDGAKKGHEWIIQGLKAGDILFMGWL